MTSKLHHQFHEISETSLVLPRSILMTEDRRSLTRIPRLSTLVPGTVSEGLNGWSEALTVGLAV